MGVELSVGVGLSLGEDELGFGLGDAVLVWLGLGEGDADGVGLGAAVGSTAGTLPRSEGGGWCLWWWVCRAAGVRADSCACDGG